MPSRCCVKDSSPISSLAPPPDSHSLHPDLSGSRAATVLECLFGWAPYHHHHHHRIADPCDRNHKAGIAYFPEVKKTCWTSPCQRGAIWAPSALTGTDLHTWTVCHMVTQTDEAYREEIEGQRSQVTARSAQEVGELKWHSYTI